MEGRREATIIRLDIVQNLVEPVEEVLRPRLRQVKMAEVLSSVLEVVVQEALAQARLKAQTVVRGVPTL